MRRSFTAVILLAAVACFVAADGAIEADNAVELDPTSSRNLLVLGIRTHEAKKAAADQVKANSNPGTAKGDKAAAKAVTHQNRAGVAVPGVTGTSGRRLLEAEVLGIRTHEAKKAAADQVKANANPGTAKGDKAAAKAVTHQGRAGVAVPGVTGMSGRHLLEDETAPRRDLLILGYRTHEAKKAAAAQVKANAHPGTAKGNKEAAKALKYQARAGVQVPGVTGVSGRHLLEEENEVANRNLLILGYKTHEAKKAAKESVKADTHAKRAGIATPTATTAPGRRLQEAAARDLLILGYRTHEAKRAAADQVKANAHPGTAKGDKEAAKALSHQAKAGVAVPGVTGMSGRRLLEEENEAANRNLLILGYKTHEAKKAAKEAVKADTHAKRAGIATPTATTAPGRHLLEEQEAAARNLLILGYKTHEAKKAAKESVKADTHAKRAGIATPMTTAPGRHLLEEQVLGIRTHEAKKAAADQVKANANPGTAKGDKAAAKAVTHQNRVGVAVPGVTGTSGRHL